MTVRLKKSGWHLLMHKLDNKNSEGQTTIIGHYEAKVKYILLPSNL